MSAQIAVSEITVVDIDEIIDIEKVSEDFAKVLMYDDSDL